MVLPRSLIPTPQAIVAGVITGLIVNYLVQHIERARIIRAGRQLVIND